MVLWFCDSMTAVLKEPLRVVAAAPARTVKRTWLFSALFGLRRQTGTNTLNIGQMSVKLYATALLPSPLPCGIVRRRGHRVRVVAVCY